MAIMLVDGHVGGFHVSPMVVSVSKSEPDSSSTHTPVVTQAPVKALDPDGVGVISIGTAAFVVAAIVFGVTQSGLAATGHLWFLWVAITGAVLGVLALAGLISGRRRRRARAATPIETKAPEALN